MLSGAEFQTSGGPESERFCRPAAAPLQPLGAATGVGGNVDRAKFSVPAHCKRGSGGGSDKVPKASGLECESHAESAGSEASKETLDWSSAESGEGEGEGEEE